MQHQRWTCSIRASALNHSRVKPTAGATDYCS
ncbi:hypothetical protein X801_08844 [Opisthorchis viverrini]|uniref:Uncharacterized protein n=1 Tax=Opisthorchis viverrini TaxID=6198 RepID=A0A1S8WLN0_OPIVI|nr:hypothetical protein X801_08844 [Opisthorchis viverrini]